jgi:dTDP-4-dehydrorhamnose reductase
MLITGLNGVVGWALFEEARKTCETFGTYRKRNKAFRGDKFLRVDLDDEKEVEALVASLQPRYVIHSRSICDLDVCEQTPDLALKVNVEGTAKLVRAVRGVTHFEKMIYLSTDHVFSGEKGSYTEEDIPEPKHVFGRTKLAAERIVEGSGLPYIVIRPGLVIGASAQGVVGPRDFLFSRIRAGKPTTYFTDEWRTPIPSDVLAKRVLALAFSAAQGIYHIAGNEVTNRYELATRLAEEYSLPTENIYASSRAQDHWSHIRPEHLTLKSKRLKT